MVQQVTEERGCSDHTQDTALWLEDRSRLLFLKLQNGEIAQDFLPFTFHLKYSMTLKTKNCKTCYNLKACTENAKMIG